MTKKLSEFSKAYIKSMRPYTFFVTGIAGILGILLVDEARLTWSKIVVLLLLFTSYGINQVINDLLGAKEDKHNAPSRPLVSGELSKRAAVLTTLFLFLIGAVATYFLNPCALVVYFLAYLMNIIYEYLKGVPFVGNLWFGFMIGLAPLYGLLALTSLTTYSALSYPNLMFFVILVVASSSSLCYYTYFKDYEGDKKVGKNTLVVVLGPKRAKYLNFPMTFLPFFLMWAFIRFSFLKIELNYIFLSLIVLASVFCCYAAFFSFRNLGNNKKALELNFECTPLFLSSLVSLLDPFIGIILFILSFVFIKTFYWLMYRKTFY